MIVIMLFMVLFWGALVFVIVWLIRGSFDRRSAPRSESPTDVLERRFAEGEISVEDYLARREILVSPTAGSNGAGEDEPFTTSQEAGAER